MKDIEINEESSKIFFLKGFCVLKCFLDLYSVENTPKQQNQPLEKGIHVSHGIPGNACIKLQQPLGGQGAPCVFDLRCFAVGSSVVGGCHVVAGTGG